MMCSDRVRPTIHKRTAPQSAVVIQLARILEIEERDLWRIVSGAPTMYERRLERKPGGGSRRISAPREPLKKVQRRVLSFLERVCRWHRATTAGVPGGSQRRHASAHVNRAWVATEDLSNFFDTVTHHRIRQVLTKHFGDRGYSSGLARLVTRLVTYNGCLPQGAPTSAVLGNVVLEALDRRLHTLAHR